MIGTRGIGIGLVLGLLAAPVALAEAAAVTGCYAKRGNRVLLDDGADTRLAPASTLKLILVAGALERLGPDYRAVTRLTVEGRIDGPKVDGDLVIHGGGDPTWNRRFFEDDPEAPIRALIRPLIERGVRQVDGDLVVDTAAFPGRAFPSSRSIDELAFAFGAPTSALAVGENAVRVRIAPGPKVGAPASAEPLGDAGLLTLDNSMSTVPATRHERGTVDIQPVWDSRTLRLHGEYPISEPPYTMPLAVPDGDRFAASVVRRALADAGVVLRGEIRVRRRYEPRKAGPTVEISRWTSPPLSRWLPPILQESQNWYADMLLRHLTFTDGVQDDARGRLDGGLDVLEELFERELGIPEDAVHLEDGSGVSPYNLVSARVLVHVLEWARSRPWRDVFIEALPRSKQGTLSAWPALPRHGAAKTGTLKHALGLAGYLRLDTAEPVAFACLVNHSTAPRQVLRRELVSRISVLSEGDS